MSTNQAGLGHACLGRASAIQTHSMCYTNWWLAKHWAGRKCSGLVTSWPY